MPSDHFALRGVRRTPLPTLLGAYDSARLSLETVAPLIAACLFGLISGFNDGGNMLASFTSGRVISPPAAAILLLVCLGGPLVLGTAVAQTIGSNVIDLGRQGELGYVLIVVSPLTVVLLSWRFGIPTSMTLALVGGMIGWVLASNGRSVVHWPGVARVLIGIPISVLGGGLLALAVYWAIRRFFGTQAHAALLQVARLQLLTAAVQAFAYGANDMEKTVGLIAVGISLGNHHQQVAFSSPLPIIGAFGFFYVGALVGGWRVASRIGFGVLKVRPVQALAQQLASGSVVAVLAAAGAPVSMTQTIDGGLVGVGAAQRASSVRWGIVRELLFSWLLTLPLAVAVAAALHFSVRSLGLAP
jgi:inorganic phosphate transporter, PiT family